MSPYPTRPSHLVTMCFSVRGACPSGSSSICVSSRGSASKWGDGLSSLLVCPCWSRVELLVHLMLKLFCEGKEKGTERHFATPISV
jgi:hypothetical protein